MDKSLYKKSASKKFYENRFVHGKISGWSDEKKSRVIDMLKEIGLPETGLALDFGCGNGFFTDILSQALPGWRIHGCDLSETAVSNARFQYPDCRFFVLDKDSSPVNGYDL
jgi:trans-aconitate methyltransferase